MKDSHDLSNEARRAALRRQGTASSLLQSVRSADAGAWSRLAQLYGPLVEYWARQAGLGVHDSADIAQEVFQVVYQRIQDFRRDRAGDSFRKWLKAIAHNKIREHWRRLGRHAVAKGGSAALLQMNQVAEPSPTELEHERTAETEIGWLHQRAMELIRDEFAPTTWCAFYGVLVENRAAADVAADLGISRNAVYIAKSRILSRLRAEFSEVLAENNPNILKASNGSNEVGK